MPAARPAGPPPMIRTSSTLMICWSPWAVLEAHVADDGDRPPRRVEHLLTGAHEHGQAGADNAHRRESRRNCDAYRLARSRSDRLHAARIRTATDLIEQVRDRA